MPVLNTVLVNGSPTLLYGAKGTPSPLTIINLDPVSTIWVGNVSNISPNAPQSLPLLPGGSISFDGSVSVYAVSAGQQVSAAVTPGGVSYSPGSGTQALYSGGSASGSPSAFNIPALGSIQVVALAPVAAFASYDLSAYICDPNQSAAGHALTCQVQVLWYDDTTSAIPVFVETWHPWVSNATPSSNPVNGITATGPMHGQYMTIQINNPGSSAIEVQWLEIYGSPRNTALSDWRQPIGSAPPADHTVHTFTDSAGNATDNILFDAKGALGAGLSYFCPIGLYSGPVDFLLSFSAAPTANPIIVDMGGNYNAYTSGSIPTSFPNVGCIWFGGLGVNQTGSLFLSRGAHALIIPTAVASTCSFRVTAQQGP